MCKSTFCKSVHVVCKSKNWLRYAPNLFSSSYTDGVIIFTKGKVRNTVSANEVYQKQLISVNQIQSSELNFWFLLSFYLTFSLPSLEGISWLKGFLGCQFTFFGQTLQKGGDPLNLPLYGHKYNQSNKRQSCEKRDYWKWPQNACTKIKRWKTGTCIRRNRATKSSKVDLNYSSLLK